LKGKYTYQVGKQNGTGLTGAVSLVNKYRQDRCNAEKTLS
jgi:hypothetical protein